MGIGQLHLSIDFPILSLSLFLIESIKNVLAKCYLVVVWFHKKINLVH